ncbi:MAG TPA: hypothetical protein VHA53_01185 [Nitrolancea sp.]|jgi:hypothetical protein|nr:hypothetical protein [Nitrolancea sp.]
MSIEQISQAMARNRREFDAEVDRIRASESSRRELRACLTNVWLNAMQRHYQLLWDYLQLRDEGTPQSRLSMEQLRAPVRPSELPEALSRYVTTSRQPDH